MHKSYLIVYYTESGSTKDVATLLAERLNARIINVKERMDDLEIGDSSVIICTPNKFGKPAKPILDFITRSKEQLNKNLVSVCFTCMDCYDVPEEEQTYPCIMYKDSNFIYQVKSGKQMNSWEKSHSVSSYLDVVKKYFPGELHLIAFFKGNLSFKDLRFWDALTMRFISLINPKIRQGYYLKKEDVETCTAQF